MKMYKTLVPMVSQDGSKTYPVGTVLELTDEHAAFHLAKGNIELSRAKSGERVPKSSEEYTPNQQVPPTAPQPAPTVNLVNTSGPVPKVPRSDKE